MVKISYIIIGYNISDYITRCLESVLNQNLQEFEIIFVNDGSTDDTLEIVSQFAKNDKRIKIINQQNLGANSARKNGFLSAVGEYVVFIDGDDWLEPSLGKNMYNLASSNSYDIIAYGHYYAYDNKKIEAEINIEGELTGYEYLDNIICNNMSHNLWNKFYKKSFLVESKFIDIPNITMGDDLAANVRMGIYKPDVLIIREYYYNYYQNQNSVTRKISPKILEMEITINDIKSALIESGLYKRYEKQVEYLKFTDFYYRVVKSIHKDCEIRREIYKRWKSQNICIDKNEYCIRFVKQRPFLERILMNLYNYNYKLGYLISRVYLGIKNR